MAGLALTSRASFEPPPSMKFSLHCEPRVVLKKPYVWEPSRAQWTARGRGDGGSPHLFVGGRAEIIWRCSMIWGRKCMDQVPSQEPNDKDSNVTRSRTNLKSLQSVTLLAEATLRGRPSSRVDLMMHGVEDSPSVMH